jgi:ribosomal protein S12 methylthiotransferase accessory factor
MGRYPEAISVLEKGLAADPQRTDIYNLLGFCHYQLKNYRRAIGNFEQLLQIDPSSAIDYANIGSNYRALGEREKAINYFQLALSLDPEIDFARKHLADLIRNNQDAL